MSELSDQIRKAQNQTWAFDKTEEGAPGASHTVHINPGGGFDVHLDPDGVMDEDGTFDFEKAKDALVTLLQDTLGEYKSMVDFIDFDNLRITFGRHPSGETTVWIKVPPLVGLPDLKHQQVAATWVERIANREPLPPSWPSGPQNKAIDVGIEVSDGQLGKGTVEKFGLSHDETVERAIWFAKEGLRERFSEYRTLKKQVQSVEIGINGDMTEGCSDSYDNQLHTVSLDSAAQLEIATSIVDAMVEELVDMGVPLIRLTGVASNHDQMMRANSKKNTTTAWDDRTFALLRNLARGYSKNPERYSHVRVESPADPHVACFETSLGLKVARIHGHVPKKRASIEDTMWEWWDKQIASGLAGAGGADVLSTSHYHHPFERRQAGRILIGNPTFDNGSQWWTDTAGLWSTPGLRVWEWDGKNFKTEIMYADKDLERRSELLNR